MVDVNSKRKPSRKDANSKANRKKQKLKADGNDGQVLNSLPIDSLDWQDVSIPHRIDDYEGFFGLEEVDGVEVLREQGSEKVQFKVVESQQRPGKGAKAQGASDMQKTNGREHHDHDDEDISMGESSTGEDEAQKEEDDWEGFSSDEDEEGRVQAVDAAAKTHNDQRRKNAITFENVKNLPFSALSEETLGDDNGCDSDESDQNHRNFDTSAWNPLHLSRKTLRSLARLGFSRPTPIQSAAIPKIMRGRDVIGKASTGSGKTLAFGIPIFEHYLATMQDHGDDDHYEYGSDSIDSHDEDEDKEEATSTPQALALIISPTRELAHQIRSHLIALCSSSSSSSSQSYRPSHSSKPNRHDSNNNNNNNNNNKNPSIITVTGGLSIQKQRRLLKHAHIVIATPGRLWEVMGESADLVDRLKRSPFFVIDEADRLLSDGHFEEFSRILEVLGKAKGVGDDDDDDDDGENGEKTSDAKEDRETKKGKKSEKQQQQQQSQTKGLRREKRVKEKDRVRKSQTLVFSATFSRDLQERLNSRKWRGGGRSSGAGSEQSMAYLLDKLRFREKPDFIDVNPVSQMAEGLKEGIVECGAMEKDLYLYTVILQNPSKRKLVFTNSISAVRRLVPFLQALNLPTNALHSHMPQKARLRSIERFSAASSTDAVLVSTDVAARGLDIPGVDLIVHYHVPRTADAYVHRSGRTARGSNVGASILICGPEEVAGVRRLVSNLYRSVANGDASEENGKKKSKYSYDLRQLDLDRRIISQLKPRVSLAKQLADTKVAQEKVNNEKSLFQEAADDLGVDYEGDEDFQLKGRGKGGRGSARKRAEVEARKLTKGDIQVLRAELKHLLMQRVNLGVSERYITNGSVDIQSLLNGKDDGRFLGRVGGLAFG